MTHRCTVITPCFNDGAFLHELRRSIALNEAVSHVIVDDGSNDPDTVDTLASIGADPDVTVLRTTHRGPAAARNLAIRSVRTRYVMAVDADDIVMPGAIRDLADALDADDALSVAWGDSIVFGTKLAHIPSAADLDPWWFTFVNDVVVGLMGRTDVLDRAGWDETSSYEDWGTTLSLIELGARGRNIGRVTYGYRLHAQPRRLAEAMAHDDAEIRNLRQRHPSAFERRRDTRRRSSAPLSVRIVGTTMDAVPWVSLSARHRWVNRLSTHLWRRRWMHHPGDLPRSPVIAKIQNRRTTKALGEMAVGLSDIIPTARHVVVVSPHRDDAVLSAFALLDDPALTADVMNVFTGPTSAADWVDRAGFATAEGELEVRQLEDQRALAGRAAIIDLHCSAETTPDELRALVEHQLDLSLRTHADGLVVAIPAGAGRTTQGSRLHDLGPVARVLGSGTSVRHTEHLAARDATVEWALENPDVTTLFYDELPYHWAKSAVRDGDGLGLFHLPVDTSTKATAVRCYASQVNSLFTTEQLAHLERWLPTVESYRLATATADHTRGILEEEH